ncbi:MAG: GNAT family N-acetyltransferase [Pseudomonadota bacterium]
MNVTSEVSHYRTRILHSLADVGQKLWDQLILSQPDANPFLSYAFLHALHESGSASKQTGWSPCYISVWDGESLAAVMPLYEKSHSYGEYVFDWAWAEAYHQHGLQYYPKLLSAIPFTPITGTRLIARDTQAQQALLNELIRLQTAMQVSSTHILFPTKDEAILLNNAGFLLRQGIQFHWQNHAYADFEEFLSSLEKKKRKNIRAERRKVAELGIEFQHLCGSDIHADDWHFFKSCYDQTYSEHHSSPYLNLDFFLRIGAAMPENIHLIIAHRGEKRIATSLLIQDTNTVYGRYWGCIEHFPCLHFETAYYQAIEFCIKNKIKIFEGGAQGEHKMARGFLPTKTYSAHFLAEDAFSAAVANFLRRETGGIENYFSELDERTPYKQSPTT